MLPQKTMVTQRPTDRKAITRSFNFFSKLNPSVMVLFERFVGCKVPKGDNGGAQLFFADRILKSSKFYLFCQKEKGFFHPEGQNAKIVHYSYIIHKWSLFRLSTKNEKMTEIRQNRTWRIIVRFHVLLRISCQTDNHVLSVLNSLAKTVGQSTSTDCQSTIWRLCGRIDFTPLVE